MGEYKNKQAKIKEIKIGDRTYEVIDGFTTLKSITHNYDK